MPLRKWAVKPISPKKPETRDERPRPIVDGEQDLQDARKVNHYMKLADLALARPVKDET